MSRAHLLERVVTGSKTFGAINPKTNKHYVAEPGETVFVNPAAAEAFSDRLVHPEVREAQLNADLAVKTAREAEAEAIETARTAGLEADQVEADELLEAQEEDDQESDEFVNEEDED